MPVNIQTSLSQEQRHVTTNQEGAAFDVFSIDSAADITVEVGISLDTVQANHTPLCAKPEVLKVGSVMVD